MRSQELRYKSKQAFQIHCWYAMPSQVVKKENIPALLLAQTQPAHNEAHAPAKLKSKVHILCYATHLHFFCLHFWQACNILPGNIAMSEQIRQLHELWECNMMTSEFCFIPADSPHFTLSHDHMEKWAAAIVHQKYIYLQYSLTLIEAQRPWTCHSQKAT